MKNGEGNWSLELERTRIRIKQDNDIIITPSHSFFLQNGLDLDSYKRVEHGGRSISSETYNCDNALALEVMSNREDNPINWDDIHKGIITSDRKRGGTVVAQTEDDIVISDGVVKRHQYIMPKSKVDYYDGSDVYLKIPSQLLSIFEVGK